MSDITKKIISLIGLLPTAIVGVILRKVFQVWGIFDPFSEWLGDWLKMHVAPAQVEWTIAGILALGAYAVLLWIVWWRRVTPIADAPLSANIPQPQRGIKVSAQAGPNTKQPLEIILGTGAPFDVVEPSGVNRTRIVRVKLQNNTDTEISNGTLKLLNLDPPNNGYKDFLLKDYITIGPHGRIFISVAAYNEGTSEALVGQWIQLIIQGAGGYFMPATFGHLHVGIPHTFHLNLSCLNGIYDEVYCRLHVDSDNVLHLERR
jgi:hypothetical protein